MTSLFVRFAAAGAVGTLLHYAVMFALVDGMHVAPELASMLGAACGAACNYFLNRRFSFRTNRSHVEAAPRFFVMVIFSILANGAIVKMILVVGQNYVVAQLFATMFVLGLSFFICKLWIFTKAS